MSSPTGQDMGNNDAVLSLGATQVIRVFESEANCLPLVPRCSARRNTVAVVTVEHYVAGPKHWIRDRAFWEVCRLRVFWVMQCTHIHTKTRAFWMAVVAAPAMSEPATDQGSKRMD